MFFVIFMIWENLYIILYFYFSFNISFLLSLFYSYHSFSLMICLKVNFKFCNIYLLYISHWKINKKPENISFNPYLSLSNLKLCIYCIIFIYSISVLYIKRYYIIYIRKNSKKVDKSYFRNRYNALIEIK